MSFRSIFLFETLSGNVCRRQASIQEICSKATSGKTELIKHIARFDYLMIMRFSVKGKKCPGKSSQNLEALIKFRMHASLPPTKFGPL